MNNFPPIVALSSGQPPSGVALVRVSGEGCIKKILSCLSLKVDESNLKERYMYYTSFISPDSKEVIDDINVAFYLGPRSYTGEDSVEIFCHGGRYVIDTIIDVIVRFLGIRLAVRGEFTKRAYLNGKIDLLTAESIKGLIEAVSYEGWLCASNSSQSRLKEKIESMKQELIESISLLEARIDFPEEESVNEEDLKIKESVTKVKSMIEDLISTFKSVQMLKEGLLVSIIGEPNSGKSTLTNTLLDKDRCIVSEIPGTTRDYVEDSCFIEGKLVRLIDTAGIRNNTEDIIEQIGISRSIEKIQEADLILCLCSCEAPLSSYMNQCLEDIRSKQKPCIVLISKSDLEKKDKSILTMSNSLSKHFKTISISCKDGTGINELKNEIVSFINKNTTDLKSRSFIFSLRHKQALRQAISYLDSFFKDQGEGIYDECLAQDLMLATKSLESIIGNVENSEILNKIFDSFCIGK